jgi:putative membrane protein
MKKFILLSLVLTVTMWGCKEDDNQPALSDTDKQFVAAALFANLAEVQLGYIASDQASDAEVKAFGSKMINDHQTAYSELQRLAVDKKEPGMAEIPQEHTQLKERLMTMTGYEFDTAYVHTQVKDHQKAITLFQNAQANGQDDDVKAYAAKYLPHLQEHLTNVQTLQNKLEPDELE